MNTIAITLHVNAAAAVRAGRTDVGPQVVRLTAEDLATLNPRQRETLALHLERRDGYAESLTTNAPPVAVADVATVAKLLDLRADAMEAAQRAPTTPPSSAPTSEPIRAASRRRIVK